MQSQFKLRYEGFRWRMLIHNLEGVEGQGVIKLQKTIQYYIPYLLPIEISGSEVPSDAEHLALIGTTDHPLICRLINEGHITSPEGEEGYSLFFGVAPWNPEFRLLVVAGGGPRGGLYGSLEAAARLSVEGGTLLDGFAMRRHALDNATPFTVREKPAIPRRGLWTWGYAIYDYRAYLDNMASLRMNTIVIWNDQAPLNLREVIAYAHSRGIEVILGFHCGWGFYESLDLSSSSDRNKICTSVIESYTTQYADLPHDGVYFQTLTEHQEQKLNGASTALWVCTLINEVADALLKIAPGLHIEFGIHATSIKEDYVEFAQCDPRVEIMWEDCGSLPFSYFPQQVETFEETLEWSRKLAKLRPGTDFSMVAKGWLTLRWDRDFENHTSFLLGERSPSFMRERLVAREREWAKVNHYWMQNYPLAARFYREMIQTNSRICVTGLVEDALFENCIQPSVALFAEMLWNPHRSDSELLARATRPSYAP